VEEREADFFPSRPERAVIRHVDPVPSPSPSPRQRRAMFIALGTRRSGRVSTAFVCGRISRGTIVGGWELRGPAFRPETTGAFDDARGGGTSGVCHFTDVGFFPRVALAATCGNHRAFHGGDKILYRASFCALDHGGDACRFIMISWMATRRPGSRSSLRRYASAWNSRSLISASNALSRHRHIGAARRRRDIRGGEFLRSESKIHRGAVGVVRA